MLFFHSGGGAYWVHFEVPGLARGVEVDDDLFVLQAELLEGDVGAVSPRADVVCVEDDLGGHGVVVGVAL